MFSISGNVIGQNEPKFLFLAASVCVLTSLTTFEYYRSSFRLVGVRQLRRLAGAGAVCGFGVWATHFIAMLGYRPTLQIAFEPFAMALSLMFAVVGSVAGFILTMKRKARWACGLLVGLSLCAMHYSGVLGMRTLLPLTWNPTLVVASVLFAGLGGATAFWAAGARGAEKARSPLAPGAVLVLAVLGLHFTGMTAINGARDFSAAIQAGLITRSDLAILIGAAITLVLSAAIGLTVIEAQARRISLESISAAFEGVPCGVALFGPDSRVICWNNAYSEICATLGLRLHLGISRQQMIEDLVQLDRLEEREAVRACAPGARIHRGWAARSADGREYVNRVHQLSDGGLVSIVQDVTEQRAAERALIESRDRAEAANLAKSRFLANMSHEVRTPLNGMLGMLHVIAADSLSDVQRERLAVVRESSQSLLTILNDVLDLSKIEAGRLALEEVDFDAVALVQTLAKTWEGAAQSRHLRLTVDVAPEAEGGWRGDALRVRQVLSNLLSNALKFTETGGVSLAVGVDSDQLVFQISDTGIGMDPAHVDRLFESFTQADTSTTRRHGGTGLGLAISRELVTLMGGSIAVDTQLGAGSRFRITLPLPRVARPIKASSAPAPTAPAEQRLRVLAAEDNATNQLVLRALLEALDVDLCMVGNGREAITVFCEQTFDVVLMDIQMPEVDGVDATVAIRALELREGRTRTPIIALTANVMRDQVETYFKVGMDDCVAKPIELERLYRAIERALSGQSSALAA